jgi:hypothetical protein
MHEQGVGAGEREISVEDRTLSRTQGDAYVERSTEFCLDYVRLMGDSQTRGYLERLSVKPIRKFSTIANALSAATGIAATKLRRP